MAKLSFRVDDPELLDFIYSLGRSRSNVIIALLRDCMEEGGGYVPPRIMAETGFSYKNKKPIKMTGSSVKRNTTKVHVASQTMEQSVSKEPDVTLNKEETPLVAAPPVTTESEPEPEPEPIQEDAKNDYVSSAPKISNTNLVMAGLSTFGGI